MMTDCAQALHSQVAESAGADALHLRALGHATLALARGERPPLLVTDPWLVGSVYFRSWWLQNYPSPAELDWLARAAHVYLTHEHPDHFHMPSIRRLGSHPTYLYPAFAERGFASYLAEHGYRTAVVPPLHWMRIGPGVSILSWPLWNDDSLLLIDTPRALVLNLNDAKPVPSVLRALRRLGDGIGKKRVLLASYSPASLVNSFLSDGAVLRLKRPEDYVRYVSRLADALGADFFLPFASQASFERSDSRWANAYRTGFDDLRRGWSAKAELLAPYATLDLERFTWRAPDPEAYRPFDPARLQALTAARSAAEAEVTLDDADAARLARKLNRWRFVLWPLFRDGFSVRAGRSLFHYAPGRGRVEPCAAPRGAFEIAVPALTLKEAVAHDHLSDLGITMVVRITLLRPLDPRLVYGIFVLFQFDDYGHLKSPRALLRWLWTGLRFSLPRRVAPPAPV